MPHDYDTLEETCPNCGGHRSPTITKQVVEDDTTNPLFPGASYTFSTVVFYGCPDCDFSTWDYNEFTRRPR